MRIVETLGGPDVVQIFHHGLQSLPRFTPVGSYVGEQHLFDARALFIARPRDFIIMGRPPEPAYLDWLRSLGLGPAPDHVILLPDVPADRMLSEPPAPRLAAESLPPALLRAAAGGARLQLNVYMANEWEWELAERLAQLCGAPVELPGASPECVQRLARKDVGRAVARKAGAPIPPGEIVRIEGVGTLTGNDRSRLERAFVRQRHMTGRVAVHTPYGSSGGGSMILENPADGDAAAMDWLLGKQTHDVVLIEPYLPAMSSPNVMIWVDPATRQSQVLGTSDQIMGGPLKHVGNAWPSKAYLARDMAAHSLKIGARMAELGFVGMAGFDFLEYEDPRCNCLEWCFLEINPRANAATYLLFILDLLNERQRAAGLPEIAVAHSHGVQVPVTNFADFQCQFGKWLFNPQSARGVAVLNPAMLPLGKALIAFLATNDEELQWLKRKFGAALREPDTSCQST